MSRGETLEKISVICFELVERGRAARHGVLHEAESSANFNAVFCMHH
jgi:hypothetical protein